MPTAAASSRAPFAVRCYITANRLLRWLLRGIEAVHRGVWLGLLRPGSLDAATRSMYEPSASYRDDAYNLSGLFYWEKPLVEQHFAEATRVLVPAAGGGREVIALARLGLRAEGFDPSEAFVAAGKEMLSTLGLDASLEWAPPSSVPPLKGNYNGLMFGWNAFTHLPGRSVRLRILRGLRAHVQPGCPLLLSFFPRPESDRMLGLVFRVARFVAWLSRRSEPILRGDDLNVAYFHHFAEPELAEELREAGFELVHFSRHPFGHAVARAIG